MSDLTLETKALTFVSWEKTIDDLDKKISKLTLKAVLGGIGALLCFAAAAFLPGGSKYSFFCFEKLAQSVLLYQSSSPVLWSPVELAC